MANALDLITIGNIHITVVDADPSTGGGLVSAIGSLASFNNSGTGVLYLKTSSSNTGWTNLSTGSGEANTASNVGAGGVGVFKQKSGVDLQFKNINAGSNKITITDDTGNNEVDIDITEANLTHNNIGGTLGVSKGGTGQTTYTDGQLLIGNSSGNTLTKATLTAGNNIAVTNGNGSISLASTDAAVMTVDTVATTDATVTTLKTIATSSNEVKLVRVEVTAYRTGGSSGSAGDSATYVRDLRVKNVAGTVTTNDLQSSYTSEDQTGWDLTFVVSSTNVLVKVTGASNNNIDWKSNTRIISLS